MKIPHDWLRSGVDPSKLSEHVIANADRWDIQDWRRLRKNLVELAAATDALGDITPTGRPFMADAVWSLFKVAPEIAPPEAIKPSHLVNLSVHGEAAQLPQWKEVRRFTRGDDVATAMAVVSLEPDFETLFDREKQRQAEAEELERRLQALFDALAEMAELEGRMADDDDPDLALQAEALAELIARLQADAAELADAFMVAMDMDAGEIIAALSTSLGRAAAEARELSQAADLWGVEPGKLQHLPLEERLELARSIDSDRIRKIMELFGPMRELLWAVRRRKLERRTETVHRVTRGRDLHRALPSELVKMRHPIRKREFYRDLAEGRLMVYELHGTEKVGRGGLILVEDGSGSMWGDPEMWAKAVGLNLLHLSRKQRRAFHAIHFGSRNEIAEMSFERPEDYTFEKTMAFATLFFAGGTDFQAPLDRAMGKLEVEYLRAGKVDGDIVFITDGQCGVTRQWMENFHAKKERMQVCVWGIYVGRHPQKEPLNEICDGRVCNVEDFVSGGDITKVFAGV